MKVFLTSILLFLALGSTLWAQDQIVTEVAIEGNKRTRASFLKRLAFVKEGSNLDSTRLASDVRRFKLLPSVASAAFKVEAISEKQL